MFLSLIRKLLRISLYNYSKWNTIQQTILNNNLTMIQQQQMMMYQQAMQNQSNGHDPSNERYDDAPTNNESNEYVLSLDNSKIENETYSSFFLF